MPRFVHLQDASYRGTCPARYPGLRYISRAQCGTRYSDFSPNFLSTLSTLRLTSPVDADNLYRCESYSVTMTPNVGQPQYMPPQQPLLQYQQPQQQPQQQYLPPSSSQQLYLNLAQHLQPPRTSIHLEGSSSSILSSSGILSCSGILSSSSLTSSTSSTSSRPCRRNSALHQRSTPAPHTPNTHGTPCQRTLAWPLPISQQMLPPCERLTR